MACTYSAAVMRSAAVPFGWIIGCPLLGWLISDRIGRRKPVIVGAGAALLGIPHAHPVRATRAVPALCLGLLAGIASGAAMLPYTSSRKRTRRSSRHRDGRRQLPQFLADRDLRTAFASRLMESSSGGEREIAHYQSSFPPLLYGVALADAAHAIAKGNGPERHPQIQAGGARAGRQLIAQTEMSNVHHRP